MGRGLCVATILGTGTVVYLGSIIGLDRDVYIVNVMDKNVGVSRASIIGISWGLHTQSVSFATLHGGRWGGRYSSYSFLTSALDGGEWSASRPGRDLPPGERTPGTHWIGGWVGLRACLDAGARRKILCPYRGSNLDRPVVQPLVRDYTA
jgi:hypothetical protein